ncbi:MULTISPECIES: phage tail sheath C-terminal domain-containing protein [unclassified Mycobacterium]|uniref:phage tail sheath C-terminal domain-containing protein n=1 Tax=unclassified Mycobacterium TaxID=2642494 RepID=UPI0029C78216|nr:MULTISPECIES: phage tail sheath C-terminal domain-containing protein [unclassified Mycobacterium]
MPVLVVPGVSVEANFDVLPPLPAAAGIVGVVGVVDRPPATARLVGVSRVSELQDLCGPGTVASMPEAVAALSTGAREVLVSAVAGGTAATATLMNSTEAPAVRLRARSRGAWANQLSVDVGTVTNADGNLVRVTLRILQNSQEVERFDDLIVEPGQRQDLFSVINAQSNYVVAVEPNFDGDDPKPGTYPLGAEGSVAVEQKDAAGTVLMDVKLKPGAPSDGVAVTIAGEGDEISLEVRRNGARQEFFENLTMDPDSARHLPALLSALSRFVRAVPHSSLEGALRLPRATPAPVAFAGGASPNVAAYRTAIDLLSDDPRIDLVMACFDSASSSDDVIQIHQALLAHALVASDAGAPRVAFGSIRGADAGNLDAIRDHAAAVRNRRFVLIAPPGATGAVVGLLGRINPEISPTFQPTQLLGVPPSTYRESQLNVLLGPTVNLLVVQQRAGHGVIVLKGINTFGDQISVTRVADRCIRETKAISENFIGRLNSADAREALKQQLIATFTRLERSGALVPSTDGTDPAFLVDVYSTQQDFAQGIVRVDIAVRPVRAIDYVYATIRVKN